MDDKKRIVRKTDEIDAAAIEGMQARIQELQKETATLQTKLDELMPCTVDDLFARYSEDGEVIVPKEGSLVGPRYVDENGWAKSGPSAFMLACKKVGIEMQHYGKLFRSQPCPLYKTTFIDGRPSHGGTGDWPLPTKNEDGTWTPGAWREVEGDLNVCANGLHLTDVEHLNQWASDELYEAETEGPLLLASDKYVARRVRLVRKIDPWNNSGLWLAKKSIDEARAKLMADEPELFGGLEADLYAEVKKAKTFEARMEVIQVRINEIQIERAEKAVEILKKPHLKTGLNRDRRYLSKHAEQLKHITERGVSDYAYATYLMRTKGIDEEAAKVIIKNEHEAALLTAYGIA
jgi:hypothetical protein